ncbi:hypothetical protein DPMN_096472 [Dreissena polymorpha]|uniref:Uncharacterized protein n=1 Tax=Dreissena polymorpha TaxID=45954 RepID=A0A9D4R3T9_DREPO|nr:hypothetical protein DPMN_096472 [Dreissena polymorpha]
MAGLLGLYASTQGVGLPDPCMVSAVFPATTGTPSANFQPASQSSIGFSFGAWDVWRHTLIASLASLAAWHEYSLGLTIFI